jgi:hypothetical protein
MCLRDDFKEEIERHMDVSCFLVCFYNLNIVSLIYIK